VNIRRILTNPYLILCLSVLIAPFVFADKSAYVTGVLIFCAVYTILTIGLDLLMGYTGQISVGHASFFAIGAYVSAILTTRYGLSPLGAMASGMVLSGILSWAIGRPVLALKEYYLAMATLAFNEIVISLIIGLEGLTGGASGIRGIPPFAIFGVSFKHHLLYYYLVWLITIFVIVLSRAIVNSPVGRALSAIHGDEIGARAFGIDCTKYKTGIFVIVNVFASLAGSLYAHFIGFIAPDDFQVGTSVSLLVMLYLGGIGTIWGPVIGACFLKILPEITYHFKDYELLVNGLILVFVLIFLPEGLYGTLKKITKRAEG